MVAVVAVISYFFRFRISISTTTAKCARAREEAGSLEKKCGITAITATTALKDCCCPPSVSGPLAAAPYQTGFPQRGSLNGSMIMRPGSRSSRAIEGGSAFWRERQKVLEVIAVECSPHNICSLFTKMLDGSIQVSRFMPVRHSPTSPRKGSSTFFEWRRNRQADPD